MKLLTVLFLIFFSSTSFAMSVQAIQDKNKAINLYNIRDKIKSGQYFLTAAKEGDPSSQYYYAVSIIARDGGLSNEAIKWLDKAADNGSLQAMFRLASNKVCSYGKSCPPKGKSWFDYAKKKAEEKASQGDGRAMYLLSLGYLFNSDDDDLYYKWMKKSAEADYSRGQYVWAKSINDGQGFYFTNSGRKEDVIKWAKKSFDNGFPLGGNLLASKLWGEQEAWDAIESSAKSGYVRSIGILATCYADNSKYEICKNKSTNKPKAVALANYLEEIDDSTADLYVSGVKRRTSSEDQEQSNKYDEWVRKNFKYPSYFEYIE